MTEINGKLSRLKSIFFAPPVLALSLVLGGIEARAQQQQQEERVPAQTPAEMRRESNARQLVENVAGVLRVLNLTPEQRAQIASIRRETQPQGRLLGARLRQSRRALDEAIYAANPDDAIIEERVREVGAAQAALLRLRSFTELRIRRVLSPDQLAAFRQLQRRQARTAARQQTRRNRPAPQEGVTPPDAPERFRDRMRRRQLEQRQQQQRLPNEQNSPSPSVPPREQDRRAPSRDTRP